MPLKTNNHKKKSITAASEYRQQGRTRGKAAKAQARKMQLKAEARRQAEDASNALDVELNGNGKSVTISDTIFESTAKEDLPFYSSLGSEHFLGFGLVSVILPGAGGPGPQVVPGLMQRKIRQGTIKAILDLHHTRGLERENPDYALIWAIDPSIVDKSKLTFSNLGPFELVQWLDKVEESQAHVLAGQHRIEAVRSLLSDTITEYNVLKAAADDVAEVEKILVDQSKWLVRFYDVAMLEDLGQHAGAVLHMSSNNTFRSARDTDDDQLNNILLSYRLCSSLEALESTKRVARGLGGLTQTLCKRYDPMLDLMAELGSIKLFHPSPLTARQLADAQSVIWGVLHVIILGGLELIRWLATDDDNKYWPDVADHIAEIAEEHFVESDLDQAMFLFASGKSPIWQERFDLYCACIISDVEEMNVPADTPFLGDAMLDKLRARFQQTESDDRFGPWFAGGTPLLCPSFIRALYNFADVLSPVFSMMASWYVPGCHHMLDNRLGRVKERDIIPSQSTALFETLKYHYGRGIEGWSEWEGLPSDEAIQEYNTLVNSLVAMAFKYRATIFSAHLAEIAESMKPTKVALTAKENKQLVALGAMGRKWGAAAYDALPLLPSAKPKVEDTKLRLMQTCPAEVKMTSISERQQNVALGLEASAFNWLMPKENKGTEAFQRRFIKAVWDDVARNEEHRFALLEDNPSLAWFYIKVGELIRNSSGFEHFQPWHTVDVLSEEVKTYRPPKWSDELADQRIAESIICQAKEEGIAKLTRFLRTLGPAYTVKIPTEDGDEELGLHPALARPIYDLFKAMKYVPFDVASLKFSRKFGKEPFEWSALKEDQVENFDDVQKFLKITVASNDDILKHSQEEESDDEAPASKKARHE